MLKYKEIYIKTKHKTMDKERRDMGKGLKDYIPVDPNNFQHGGYAVGNTWTISNLKCGREVIQSKRRIISIKDGVLIYETIKPLLFNRTQRHIIIHHPSKWNEWNLRLLFYKLIRKLKL